MATILIVDDAVDIRLMIRMVLSVEPHQFMEAGDGEEALAVLQQEQVDLMLLDIAMPVLDGFGVLERLQGDPKMPVVVVTANHESNPHLTRLLELGALDVIGKPFEPERLIGMVDAILKVDEDERQEYRRRRLAMARSEG